MKKLIAILLTLAMMLSLVACGGNSSSPSDNASSSSSSKTNNDTPKTIPVRISVSESASNIIGQGYTLLAEKLEELSGGVFECEVFYDGTYCSSTEALTEMAKGNLEIGPSGATYVAEYVPQYGFLQMAYLYDNYEHALKVLNGEIGKKIFQVVADSTGTLPIGAYYFGSRNIMLTKDLKVEKPEDLASIKMRTNGLESMMNMMRAMGANPVGVALSETYGALQTGVVDGQENPIAGCIAYNFPEVSKSWTYTEHYIDCSWIACSYEWFQSLTPELQDVVYEAVLAACEVVTANVLETEAKTDEILAEAGVAVYRIDKTPFEEAAIEYYSQFYDEWDTEMLNAILASK